MRRTLSRMLGIAAVLGISIGVAAPYTSSEADAVVAQERAGAQLQSDAGALQAAAVRLDNRSAALAALAASLGSAADAVDGRTLDAETVVAARAQVAQLTADAAAAHELAVSLERLAVQSPVRAEAGRWPTDRVVSTAGIVARQTALADRSVDDLDDRADAVTKTSDGLHAAEVAWQAEQERLAAERAAAEARAAQRRSAPAAPASNGPRHVTVFVRASASWSTAQAMIDQGGQIGVNYSELGLGWVVAAHNWSSRIALTLHDGDLVTFTGVVSGTYVVRGRITIPSAGTPVTELEALDTQMHMMTCEIGNGLSRVIGLVPA